MKHIDFTSIHCIAKPLKSGMTEKQKWAFCSEKLKIRATDWILKCDHFSSNEKSLRSSSKQSQFNAFLKWNSKKSAKISVPASLWSCWSSQWKLLDVPSMVQCQRKTNSLLQFGNAAKWRSELCWHMFQFGYCASLAFARVAPPGVFSLVDNHHCQTIENWANKNWGGSFTVKIPSQNRSWSFSGRVSSRCGHLGGRAKFSY